MRILVFGMSSLLGGVESFILSNCREMKRQDASLHFDFLCIDEVPPFLYDMKDSFAEQGDVSQRFHIVPSRIRNPFAYKRAIDAVFENNDFDCFWFNICTLSDIAPAIEASRRSVPVFVHAHNSQNMGNWMNGMLHDFHKRTIQKYADCYLSCSDEASAFMFPSSVCSSDAHHVVPNAIEIDKFKFSPEARCEIRDQYGIGDKIVFGHVGRFHSQKNHSYLIKIFQSIHDELDNSMLLLIGGGTEKQKTQSEVKELGLSDSVIFAGESHRIEKMYSAMDCFLFPSLYEGFGLVALEAQASGLPCVVTENSPSMISVLDSCVRLPVTISPKEWARVAIDSVNIVSVSRESCAALMSNSGFDICGSAKSIIALFRDHAYKG